MEYLGPVEIKMSPVLLLHSLCSTVRYNARRNFVQTLGIVRHSEEVCNSRKPEHDKCIPDTAPPRENCKSKSEIDNPTTSPTDARLKRARYNVTPPAPRSRPKCQPNAGRRLGRSRRAQRSVSIKRHHSHGLPV